MDTKLIKLKDGTLIEVDYKTDGAQQISASLADKVESSLTKIKPILVKTVSPVIEAWKELKETVYIEQGEVELGLSFEAEGNIYIAKSKLNSNLKVKLIFKKEKNISEN